MSAITGPPSLSGVIGQKVKGKEVQPNGAPFSESFMPFSLPVALALIPTSLWVSRFIAAKFIFPNPIWHSPLEPKSPKSLQSQQIRDGLRTLTSLLVKSAPNFSSPPALHAGLELSSLLSVPSNESCILHFRPGTRNFLLDSYRFLQAASLLPISLIYSFNLHTLTRFIVLMMLIKIINYHSFNYVIFSAQIFQHFLLELSNSFFPGRLVS